MAGETIECAVMSRRRDDTSPSMMGKRAIEAATRNRDARRKSEVFHQRVIVVCAQGGELRRVYAVVRAVLHSGDNGTEEVKYAST